MAIDWFTFSTQLVNFLILVWLLKKFLYRPVLEAMAKRKAGVAEEIAVAKREREEAAAEKKRLRAMQEEMGALRERELLAVRQEIDDLRALLTAEARAESELARRQWLAAVAGEQRAFLDRAAIALVEQFDKLSRAALSELADEKVERRIIEVFFARIARREENLAAVREAVSSDGELLVSTGFALDEETRERCREFFSGIAGRPVDLRFESEGELLAGIAVRAGDWKIQWNLDRYLDDFRRDYATVLAGKQAGP